MSESKKVWTVYLSTKWGGENRMVRAPSAEAAVKKAVKLFRKDGIECTGADVNKVKHEGDLDD